VTKQAVTLGDLACRVDRLEVRCKRCDRQGRMRLTKLIAEHGAELGLPELAVLLAVDCPKVAATNQADRCFVHFPQLAGLSPAG
jgi:hypothetical protein